MVAIKDTKRLMHGYTSNMSNAVESGNTNLTPAAELPTALLRRLRFYTDLTHLDETIIANIDGQHRQYDRNVNIVTAGQKMTDTLVMRKGWAIRYKELEDGRRQILNVLLPGDIFDLQVLVAAEADHNVMSVTNVTVFSVKPAVMRKILAESGTLTMAFWWTQVQEEAFLREQIVRNGRQTARERIGSFLLELHRRAQIVDEAGEHGFKLPLTQTHIADALGLTPIHTNRVLQQLSREGYIERDRSWILFRNADALAELCEFDPSYFHLDAYKMRLSHIS
jgi:CRP-like cAMP-binding protein